MIIQACGMTIDTESTNLAALIDARGNLIEDSYSDAFPSSPAAARARKVAAQLRDFDVARPDVKAAMNETRAANWAAKQTEEIKWI